MQFRDEHGRHTKMWAYIVLGIGALLASLWGCLFILLPLVADNIVQSII